LIYHNNNRYFFQIYVHLKILKINTHTHVENKCGEKTHTQKLYWKE